MFERPERRVKLTARNIHDGRSRSITLMDCEANEVIERVRSALSNSESTKGKGRSVVSKSK